MIRDEDHWLSVNDAFHAAAVGDQTWYSALEGLAAATGSSMGELIGIGADAAVPFNIMTNLGPSFAAEFAAIGGGDPAINPRVKAGMSAPPLQVLAESDFITPEEYRRHPHLQEVARRWGIAHICLTTLERKNGMLIGLAVGRTQRDGHVTTSERAVFASIAPHVRAAVRTQLALEGQGARLIAGTLEALSIPAFVCDQRGRVQALSPLAERLVQADCGLHLSQGELRARRPGEARMLAQAIAQAAHGFAKPGAPAQHTVVVRAEHAEHPPLMLEVIALPRHWQHEFNFTPRVLVVVRGTGAESGASEARRSALLQAVYGLTPAETDIALRLAAGKTAEAIAAGRHASIETVRTQIKAIRVKMKADHLIDLVARLNQL